MKPVIKKELVGIISSLGHLGIRIYRFISFAHYPPEYKEEEIGRILIINLHYIGDVLFTTPVIRLLRHRFPRAYRAIWVKSRAREVVINNPGLDEVLVFDDITTARGRERINRFNFRGRLNFLRLLRKKKFDLTVDLTGLWSTALMALLSRVSHRIGINKQGFGFLLTKEASWSSVSHLRQRYLKVLEVIGFKSSDLDLEFFLKKENMQWARQFLARPLGREQFLVGIHPGAGWSSKRWLPDRFAQLGDELYKRYRARVILFGSSQDRLLINHIVQLMGHPPILTKGQINLGQMAALIKKCALYIGNDTGPTYIAEALGIPTITIFGSTNPNYSAPLGRIHRMVRKEIACSPRGEKQYCYLGVGKDCPHHRCMELITVEDVLKMVEELITFVRKEREKSCEN